MRVAFASVIAATATMALAQPSARGHKSINPDISVVQSFGGWDTVTAEPQPATNAERFARNLPPLKPKAHRSRPHRGGPHTGTRVKSAPRAESSPVPPMSKRCLLKVTGVDSMEHGFVSSQFNDFGEYSVQENQDGALEVNFSYAADSPSQIDFTTVNGQQSVYPYFGAIGGPASDSDDLGEGDNSYVVIGGTSKTPAGSPPSSGGNTFSTVAKQSENSESAIWKYDPVSQAITVQWINTDGSAPANHILFANDSYNNLVITGDVAAFQAEYDEYPEVVLECVPPVSSEVVPT